MKLSDERCSRLLGLIFFMAYLSCSYAQIHIAYTTNLNGNLQPCQCQENELGSMVRLATAVDSLRQIFPDLILIDSGDFLKSYPVPVANKLMADFMKMMNYTVIGVGDQEFVEGDRFFEKTLYGNSLPMVSANIKFTQSDTIKLPQYRIFEQNGIKIGITSVLHPQAFDFIMARDIEILPIEETLEKIVGEMEKKTDLIIVLYHIGSREGLDLMKKFKDIDILIAGHSQEKTETRVEDRYLLQTGYDGEYLGWLEIETGRSGFNISNQFLPISESYKMYPAMKMKIDEFNELLDETYY